MVTSALTLVMLFGFLILFRYVLELVVAWDDTPSSPGVFGEYLVHILFAGVFPLSAVAYGLFQHGSQEAELTRDLSLLGIEQNSGTIGNETGNEYKQIIRRYKAGHSQWNYAFQYALPLLTTVLGLHLFFHASSELLDGVLDPLSVTAMRYGFLGAYIYSIQYIYRRYTTLDLQPSVYMHCGVVLLAGIVFNYVAFNFLDATDVAAGADLAGGAGDADGTPRGLTPVEGGLQAIVAFSLGYFPALAIRWFSRVAYGALGVKQRRADFLPLGLIDGISQFHESRLRDQGIDNIQNLASARIDELMMNTPFNLQQTIEWIDQSILYIYLEQSEIESFRRGGVRSITDFQAHWADFHADFHAEFHTKANKRWFGQLPAKPTPFELKRHEEWKVKRATRAQQLQSTPERLDALFDTTKAGPNMAHVSHYWRATGEGTLELMADQMKVRDLQREERIEELKDEIAARRKARRADPGENSATGD